MGSFKEKHNNISGHGPDRSGKSGKYHWTIQHLAVISMQASVFLFLVRTGFVNSREPDETYGPAQLLLMQFIDFIPMLLIPVALASTLGMSLFNHFKQPDISDQLGITPLICFRTVTRGDIPGFVIKNAKANKATCLAMGLQNFVIEIVTDKPVDIDPEIHIRETVVPKWYRTPKGTLFKARALNYCLQSEVNSLTDNEWIVHLDEESLLTEEALCGIVGFIRDNRADIGQGAIIYTGDQVIQNWCTTLADCVRTGLDYTLFRFQFTCLQAPLFGFKGSYIVLKNKVETDIGFDFGPRGSIAEDCYFALMAWSKGFTFGFVKGEVKEKSPFTVMDFIRQRRRWFTGLFFVACSKDIPLLKKSGIMLGVLNSILMPLSLGNMIFALNYPFPKPIFQIMISAWTVGVFVNVNFLGTYLSFYKRKWSKRWLIFVCLLNCTIINFAFAVVEGIAIIWGLFTLNRKEFHIIKKETYEDCGRHQKA